MGQLGPALARKKRQHMEESQVLTGYLCDFKTLKKLTRNLDDDKFGESEEKLEF